MTLDEYYKAVDELQAPEELQWHERHSFYMKEMEKLRSQLSKEDLKIVLEEQRHWENKMQSGVA